MRVYFQIDRAEALRRGKNSGSKLASVDFDPATLSEEQRSALANHVKEADRSSHDNYGVPVTELFLRDGMWNCPVTLSDPSVEGVWDFIRGQQEKARAKEAAEVAEQNEKREKTLAVLRERKTVETNIYFEVRLYADGSTHVGGDDQRSHSRVENETMIRQTYSSIRADLPYYYDSATTDTPEWKAWQADLGAENARRRAAAVEEAMTRVRALKVANDAAAAVKAAQEAKQAAERAAWINQHGSDRLRRCLAEGIECRAIYRDERLAFERPGWCWSVKVEGEYTEPRNPPEEAFATLDQARAMEPEAKLVRWEVEHEHSEDCNDEDKCPKYDWTAYAAVAQFLGAEIVYGLSEKVTV